MSQIHHPITQRLRPMLKRCPLPLPALGHITPLLALLCFDGRSVIGQERVPHGPILSSGSPIVRSLVSHCPLTDKKRLDSIGIEPTLMRLHPDEVHNLTCYCDEA